MNYSPMSAWRRIFLKLGPYQQNGAELFRRPIAALLAIGVAVIGLSARTLGRVRM